MLCHHKTSPQDFFLNIAAFGSLYGVLIGFGVILFAVADIISGYKQDFSAELIEAVGQGVAFFVVMLPVCIALFSHIAKSYCHFPYRRGSAVRRWLLSGTLFLAGMIAVFDAVAILISIFQGSILFTEFAKSLIVGGISAGTFILFLSEVRSLKAD